MKNNKLLQNIFMVMVIFSLFAPSIVPLLQWDNDMVAATEIIEEESKKETKKEIEENDVFCESLSGFSDFGFNLEEVGISYQMVDASDYAAEILIPPPEQGC